MHPRKLQLLPTCALLAALTGVALTAACGSSNSSSVPSPSSSPILPVFPAFTATSVMTPAASTTSKTITVPLPPTTGFSGTAALAVASIPAGLRLTVTYANEPPAGAKPLDLRSAAGGRRAPLYVLSTNVVYACIAANMLVTIDSGPQFAFVLPVSFDNSAIDYYIAILQDGSWVDGYGGPGIVSAASGSADVSVDGRFGFPIPADGQVCVALYGRYKTSSTPVPATPPPTPTPAVSPSPTPVVNPSTPTPTPVVRPSPTPVVSPSPTPVVSPSPTPVVSPSPTPTPTPTPVPRIPIASVSSVSFAALGVQYAQTFSLTEARYTGTWTETDTCAAIASVTTTDQTNFTVTPNAVGSCVITIADQFNTSTMVHVDVTSTTFGVQ